MRFGLLLVALLGWFGAMNAAMAQDKAWLQIEAQPSLRVAEDRARAYAATLPDVAGFQISQGWYAVVIGPYAPDEAAGKLRDLRRQGLIPRDSFVTDGAKHRQQYWPVGATEVPATELAPPETITAEPLTSEPLAGADAPAAEQVVEAPAAVIEVEETVQEAKASEADLTRDERKALQQAMAWYGFYSAAIDGSFGAGTRKSMAAWQEANGLEATGVLTSRQRATLLANYTADQAEFGFETLSEPEAGIEITLPMALVQFDHYEPPFVHFGAKNDSGLRVILISEPGDTASLYGMYDILQTLEVVPAAGERGKQDKSFEINAASDKVQSYAYAETSNGTVKGYLVVWEPKDAERMLRVLPAMKASFRSVGDKALDPGLVPMDDATRAGLMSGMAVKVAKFSRSGFYVDAQGSVVTTAEVVASCGTVTIDGDTEAEVIAVDDSLAVLRPKAPLAPAVYATFQSGEAAPGSEISVAGYSFEGRLPAPVLTRGRLEENAGLNGEAGVSRLSAAVLAGDAGGPVLDASGSVVGMLLPSAKNGAKVLPDGVVFALQSAGIEAAMTAAGLIAATAAVTTPASPNALNAAGMGMTVLVSCWE